MILGSAQTNRLRGRNNGQAFRTPLDKVLNLRGESKRRDAVTLGTAAAKVFIKCLRSIVARRLFPSGGLRYADK